MLSIPRFEYETLVYFTMGLKIGFRLIDTYASIMIDYRQAVGRALLLRLEIGLEKEGVFLLVSVIVTFFHCLFRIFLFDNGYYWLEIFVQYLSLSFYLYYVRHTTSQTSSM